MSFARFLEALRGDGAVRLADATPPRPAEVEAARPRLAELLAETSAEWPGPLPPAEPAATAWAAELLYRGAQALAFRDVEADVVAGALARPCPAPPGPAAIHSADAFLRYVPELLRLARGVAPGDPLVRGLLDVARAWPLSSVGARGLDPERLDEEQLAAIAAHAGLRRRYVDRILATDDVARLGPGPVREAARAALGGHPELAPAVARALAARESA